MGLFDFFDKKKKEDSHLPTSDPRPFDTNAPPPPLIAPPPPVIALPPPPPQIQNVKMPELPTLKERKNPGPYTEILKAIKEMQPQTFEGYRFALSKNLSNNLMTSHSMVINNTPESGYTFQACYVDYFPKTDPKKEPQPRHILNSEINPDFNTTASVLSSLTENLKARMTFHFKQSELVMNEYQLDYKGETYCSQLIMAQPDINLNGVLLGTHLHQVTPNLALGGQAVLQRFGSELALSGEAAVKYDLNDRSSIVAKLGMRNLGASYTINNSKNLQTGLELETDLQRKHSVATAAYKYETSGGATFKGSVNSDLQVATVIEKRIPLNIIPLTGAISIVMDHRKNNLQLGVALYTS